MAFELSYLTIFILSVFGVMHIWALFAFIWFVIKIVGFAMKKTKEQTTKFAAILATSISSFAAAGLVPPEQNINIFMSIAWAFVLYGILALFICFIRLRVHSLIFK